VTEAKPLRVLIADDERLARQRLEDLLTYETNVEIVGRTDNGLATITAIRELEPDIVFLDIQMPGKTGLESYERSAPTTCRRSSSRRRTITPSRLSISRPSIT